MPRRTPLCDLEKVYPNEDVCRSDAVVVAYRCDDGRRLRLCLECARDLTRRGLVTRLSGKPRKPKVPKYIPKFKDPCPND